MRYPTVNQINDMVRANDAEQSDLKLAELIRGDDPEAFSELFCKYYEPLYRSAARLLGDPQSAENIVQDVFVKIWTNRKAWRIRSSVKAYLYTATRNHSLNYLKREKRMSGLDENRQIEFDEMRNPENQLIDKEWVQEVWKCIEKLPRQCREIYLMKRYDCLSYSEIAQIKGISVNTVKTQLSRALKSLQKNLMYLLSFVITCIFGLC